MKYKFLIIAIAASTCVLSACSGNQAGRHANDTVDKADGTKDTLKVDTGKNTTAAPIKKGSNDSGYKSMPKK